MEFQNYLDATKLHLMTLIAIQSRSISNISSDATNNTIELQFMAIIPNSFLGLQNNCISL